MKVSAQVENRQSERQCHNRTLLTPIWPRQLSLATTPLLWKDGSAVKSTYCSCRGPKFVSQRIHQSAAICNSNSV
ncbi:hypothetical protein H671_3g11143 [Cricetulus griseus]|nr:hypothetical protein H671_3g11143 [Cricetulus griseus]